MRIDKVIIEGMHNVVRKEYDFQNLTYLHGPNGAGKSTVMQAIQLALLGYIPGTRKASKSALFEHANSRALAVTLHISDSDTHVTVTRMWYGTKSAINSSVEIEPADYDINSIISELELPIFNFSEFMNMTANTMKDWFIDFLPSVDLTTDWVQVLSEDANKVGFDTVANAEFIKHNADQIANLHAHGSEEIQKANEYFKNALSFKKKEVDRIQATIQSLIFYDDLDMTTPIHEIDAEVKRLTTARAERLAFEQAAAQNAKIQAQLADYADCIAPSYETDSRYVDASKNYAAASDKICANQEAVIGLQEAITAIRNDLSEYTKKDAEISAVIKTKQEIIDTKGVCPFTKASCDSVQPLLKQYESDIAALNKELEDIRHSYFESKSEIEETEVEIRRLNAEIAELNTQKSQYSTTISDIQYRYMTRSRLNSQLRVVPDFDDFDFDAELNRLQEIQVKYAANIRYNDLIDKLTADKFKLDQEVAVYKSWINLTGVNGLQNDDKAIQPFIDLQDDMNRYIQAVFGTDITSKFNLESKANSFSFGIERGGSYIPYNLLSSGEKCMYTLALMLSLVKASKSPLKLVLVDDLLDHLDDININKLFESLAKVDDVQMIFAGVKQLDNSNIVVEVTK